MVVAQKVDYRCEHRIRTELNSIVKHGLGILITSLTKYSCYEITPVPEHFACVDFSKTLEKSGARTSHSLSA